MATLSKELRRALERAVLVAREIAEKGAAEAIVSFGVGDAKAPPHLDEAGKLLRRKLRAHGRQVGDKIISGDIQDTSHLAQECAYEHWHRMLFARFLSENDLLRHPDHGVPLSLNECQDLAREQNLEVWELAGQFAQRMLPEIFRSDDPVLMLRLPAEARNKLLKVLNDISRDVFLADDSLGWVYQFWQAKKKDEVNESGKKIGADEIASVTQLFTEDYMVEFLLHNTLGAWWVAKRLSEGKIDQKTWVSCQTEDDCRRVIKLGQVDWKYLRFVKKDVGQWFPASGGFDGWPRLAKELKVLDPCMGSGHFLVFALPILMAFRVEEERSLEAKACINVLNDNLFGLEIDPRCAQIAAFNLALAAWKLCQYQSLPSLNLACSGIAPNTSKSSWLQLVGDNENLKFSMGRLYELFLKAPLLGSLINPREDKSITFSTPFTELLPYLEQVIALESDEVGHELVVSAKGMAKAAEILSGQFTLVATNVPYLGRGKQDDVLKDFCACIHPESKSDLATSFVERCLAFCSVCGSAALVTPQNWLFLGSYKSMRETLLRKQQFNFVIKLGEHAFDSPQAAGAFVAIFAISLNKSIDSNRFFGIEASALGSPEEKSKALSAATGLVMAQDKQLSNPDARIVIGDLSNLPLLSNYAKTSQGLKTGDDSRFRQTFWEHPLINMRWKFYQGSGDGQRLYDGMNGIVDWFDNGSSMARYQGSELWDHRGAVVGIMRNLYGGAYLGAIFDSTISPIIPNEVAHLPAIQAFILSDEYKKAVRAIDSKVAVTNATLVKVPFDLSYWQKVVAEKYPQGLPLPSSSDPTQWLFNGSPFVADQSLHVAVARLLGYQWPRQTGSNFPDCPALGSDGLKKFADSDGIVCLTSLRGELAAADRLRELLASAYGVEWTSQKEKELISATGSKANSFDDWLRDDFFAQHCILYHHRPFVWHIWDGRRDGFHALVNYHRLAEGGGAGRRTLEALVYSYLGDWIMRQRDGIKRNEAGADGRLAAALELEEELKKILAGEPPYDLFVRWKPLAKQAVGWEPDINDGVRINIRPFMAATLSKGKKGAGVLRDKPNIKWDKDRGKEPSRAKKDFPWFWTWDEALKDFMGCKDFDGNRWNDCHYSNVVKHKARE